MNFGCNIANVYLCAQAGIFFAFLVFVDLWKYIGTFVCFLYLKKVASFLHKKPHFILYNKFVSVSFSKLRDACRRLATIRGRSCSLCSGARAAPQPGSVTPPRAGTPRPQGRRRRMGIYPRRMRRRRRWKRFPGQFPASAWLAESSTAQPSPIPPTTGTSYPSVILGYCSGYESINQ